MRPKEFVLIKNCGLATSGDMFQRLEIDGKRYSHIVDPRTGVGLTDHSLVTVIAPEAMTADAVSKPVSVLGPLKGMKFAMSWSFGADFEEPGMLRTGQSPGFREPNEDLVEPSLGHFTQLIARR